MKMRRKKRKNSGRLFLLHHPKNTWVLKDNLPQHHNIDNCESLYYKSIQQPVTTIKVEPHDGTTDVAPVITLESHDTIGTILGAPQTSQVAVEPVEPSVSVVCRLCFKEQEHNITDNRRHINIHGAHGKNEGLHNKIKTLVDVDVEENKDYQATLICRPCTDKMTHFWNFRERCRRIESERMSRNVIITPNPASNPAVVNLKPP
jgi:hypothetical protein